MYNRLTSTLAMFVAAMLAGGCARPTPQQEAVQSMSNAPQNNTVYHLFVRSFADGDGDPGGVGDLKGLISKLDYLNDGDPSTDTDLEVGILWLMPIFPSSTYHGYDVTDYRTVNPEYGTLDDMRDLLREAKKRGIRVILDIPFNHSSHQHPWFLKAIENDPKYRDFYQFVDGDQETNGPWHQVNDSKGNSLKYFGLFGRNMPDLNFENPKVRKEVDDIAKFWLSLGVDGFRLDAAKHLAGWSFGPSHEEQEQNNVWWRAFSDSVYTDYPNAIIMGEVLGSQEDMIRHAKGLNGLLDEPFMNDTRKHVMNPSAGFLTRWVDFIRKAEAADPHNPFVSFPYIASHDRTPRLASELEEKAPEIAAQAQRAAFCMLMSMGKYPMIYNGDELGQRGVKWHGDGVWDETIREPHPWYASHKGPGQTTWQPEGRPGFLPKYNQPHDGISVEEQTGDPKSLLSLTRALTNLRNRLPALANGDITEIFSDSAEWMVFERLYNDQACVVLINMATVADPYRFHEGWQPRYADASIVFRADGVSGVWQNLMDSPEPINESVEVPPYGMVILVPKSTD